MTNTFDAIESRLSKIEEHYLPSTELTSNQNSFNEKEDIIGAKEVATILHLSIHTVYTKTHKRLIPHSKPGKMLLFSRKRIQEWIQESEVKTVKEEKCDAEAYTSNKLKKRINRRA